MAKETVIISLGGSLVAPDKIDLEFLDKFRNLILANLKNKRYIIYVGGGKIARLYQEALIKHGASDKVRDLVGIAVSRLNAEVIRNLFKNKCHPEIIIDPNKRINLEKDIAVGAGWKPGRSTDCVAVLSANNFKAKTVINLTNVDYVYTKNPNKFLDAQPLKEISWENFRKIVGSKWTPGYSSPFDPVASKIAEKSKIKVVIINGKNLERLEEFFNNKPFIGTVIS
jgi:uridylate kinase